MEILYWLEWGPESRITFMVFHPLIPRLAEGTIVNVWVYFLNAAWNS